MSDSKVDNLPRQPQIDTIADVLPAPASLAEIFLANDWVQRVENQLQFQVQPEDAFWGSIDHAIFELATLGYFPTMAWFRRYVEEGAFAGDPPSWFELKAYRIRHPRMADIPALLELEEECWIAPLRATEAELRWRIAENPQGQFLLEMKDGQLGAVIYSQRIVDAEALFETNFRDVAALHSADGPIAQPLAVNVRPDRQQYGLGDQLLEFLLQLSTLQPDIERVAAVTLCKHYPQHSHMPMQEYIHLRNEHGHLVDPILNFHAMHGARIRSIIEGYRPPDVDNEGNGVLIEYDLDNRLSRLVREGQRARPEEIPTIVEETVCSLLGEERAAAFSPKRPLMEMGFNSLSLLELRTLLSQRLGIEVDPTFFFSYRTTEAMIDHFLHGKQASASTASRPGEQHYTLDMLEDGDTGTPKDSRKISSERPSSERNEPIAIIGMSCRFPGGVTNPAEFWSLLVNGTDAITEVPPSRWDANTYCGEQPGQIVTRNGGFLDRVDEFDAAFFRIAPVEAKAMDPQQRLLLEAHWEALEHAGINPETLVGSGTGIYVGIFADDYKLLQVGQPTLSPYYSTGTANSVAAGRIAYFLGTEGPTMAVDTACSASLVAVHLACQSLQRCESQLALASGVNLLLSPEWSVASSQANMLAPDGRCKTFDAAANGYVRSEGCGVVVLKRLSDAQADGDNILAVIRGTAINQDGASNGLTAPNGLAQEAVIRKALSAAQVEPETISYVEAHGTGTPLGDPIEVKALEAVYGSGREDSEPLTVGSAKTNIGHTESAAGIAGLMKVVLSLQHGYIPPHLHFQAINPHLAASAIEIPKEGLPWVQADPAQPRRAALSSFGISGTNAHAIVEEAPRSVATRKRLWRPYHLLTLSAQNDDALRELAQRYITALPAFTDDQLADIASTTTSGRSHLNHRLAVTVTTIEDARAKLDAFRAGRAAGGISHGEKFDSQSTPKIAFLFTGQGAQYLQMGRELYETQPLFRQRLEQCDAVLRDCLGRSLLELLYPATPPEHNDLMESQPCGQAANFAIECALVDLWRSWGVEPDVVLGHSLGDFAAAYTAGVLSLEDGLRLVTERGRLMETALGSMVAVLASEVEVIPFIAERDDVTVGVTNGPRSVVLSGSYDGVAGVESALRKAGFKTRRLDIPVAAHSPMLDPVLDAFEAAVGAVPLSSPTLPVVSSMTGQPVCEELTNPGYWRGHLRNTVRFADSVQTLYQQDVDIFLEIGPQATLLGIAAQVGESASVAAMVSSLQAGQSDWQRILESVGELYVRGVSIDWHAMDRDVARRKMVLPTYPFQRRSYWIDTTQKRSGGEALRPLIDKRVRLPLHGMTLFEREFSVEALPALASYRMSSSIAVPAAYSLGMVLSAAELTWGEGAVQLAGVDLSQPLMISDEGTRTVQLVLTPAATNGTAARATFQLISFDAAAETPEPMTHATGTVSHRPQPFPAPIHLAALRQRCNEACDVAAFFGAAADPMLPDPSRAWLVELQQGNGEALGRLQRPTGAGTERRHLLPPELVQACFYMAAATGPRLDAPTLLPTELERLQLHRPVTGDMWWCHVRQVDAQHWSFSLFDAQGEPILEMTSVRMTPVPAEATLGDGTQGRSRNDSVSRPQPLDATGEGNPKSEEEPVPPERELASAVAQPASQVQDQFVVQLGEATALERAGMLSAHLQQEISDVLHATEPVDPRRGFFEMGMDSLMVVNLTKRLEATLQVSLPASTLFDYPSIGLLTEYLCSALWPVAEGAAMGKSTEDDPGHRRNTPMTPIHRQPSARQSPETLEQLSDVELSSLLEQELTLLEEDAE